MDYESGFGKYKLFMSLVLNIGLFAINLKLQEIEGKSILDVGSKNWDMTPAELVKSMRPSKYVGIDKEPGECVDIQMDVRDLTIKFGEESFDVVLCFEMLEHVEDLKMAILNIMQVLKPSGLLFLTTRTYGYPEHGYPDDFWRYEASDLEKIFSEFHILELEQDDKEHGVYLKARKPIAFNWDDIDLYSMKKRARIK